MEYEVNYSEVSSEYSRDAFARNGFLMVRDFFPPELIKLIYQNIQGLEEEDLSADYGGKTAFLSNTEKTGENLFGVTYVQPLENYVKKVRELMGCELLFTANHFLESDDSFYRDCELHVRHPKHTHTIPSHQDNFYFKLESPVALTCYVYLTDQGRESGGLGFLPANLPNPTRDHEKSNIEGFSSFNELSENQPNSFVYPEAKAGDVMFHHCSTFHRADPNITNKLSSSISIRIFTRSNLVEDELIKQKYEANLQYNRGNS